jgi:hypothetical protein
MNGVAVDLTPAKRVLQDARFEELLRVFLTAGSQPRSEFPRVR